MISRRLAFGFISLSHTFLTNNDIHCELRRRTQVRSKNLLFCQQRLRNMTVQLVKLRKAQLRFSIKTEFLSVEERRSFIIFQTRDKHVEESGRL